MLSYSGRQTISQEVSLSSGLTIFQSKISFPTPLTCLLTSIASVKREGRRRLSPNIQMVSFRAYSLLSLLLAAGCIAHAVSTRQQFYPSVLYLTTNKVNVMILGNLCFFLLTVLYKLCRKLFLDQLAREEEEELILHAKWSMTETCLALTLFLNEFDVTVIVLFSGLLFSKIFHWLAAMRVEQAGRVQGVPTLVHVRLLMLLTLLGLSDCFLAYRFALHLTTLNEPSVLLLFAFEFMILAVLVVSLYGAYLILVLDTRWEGRWPTKSHWVFYFGFTTDLIRLLLYVIFFIIVCTYFTVPIYLFRELWVHMFKFGDRIEKFIAYKRLTTNMKERFPEATEQECLDADGTLKKCIICRDDLTEAKKLPCGHLFHFNCLRTWLERSQRCPTCRANIPIGQARPAAADANLNIGRNNANAAGANANAPEEAAAPQPQANAAAANRQEDGKATPTTDQSAATVPAAAPSVIASVPAVAPSGGMYSGAYSAAFSPMPLTLGGAGLLSHGPGPAPPSTSPFFCTPPPLSTVQAQTLLLQQHIELMESQLAHLKTLYEAHLDFQLRLVSAAQEADQADSKHPPSTPKHSTPATEPSSNRSTVDVQENPNGFSFFNSPPVSRTGSEVKSGSTPVDTPRLKDAKSIDREAKLNALVRRLSLKREESQGIGSPATKNADDSENQSRANEPSTTKSGSTRTKATVPQKKPKNTEATNAANSSGSSSDEDCSEDSDEESSEESDDRHHPPDSR
eukprot:g58990.t1